MATVYCVGHHSVEQLLVHMMKTHNIPNSRFSIIKPDERIQAMHPNKYKKHVCFLTYQSFLRHLKLTTLPAWSKRRFFVFCSPYSAIELKPAIHFDFEFIEDSGYLQYEELDWQDYDPAFIEKQEIAKTSDAYYDLLLDIVKQTSTVLTRVMTNVYTFRKAFQKPFTYDFCMWLYNGGTSDELKDILMFYKRKDKTYSNPTVTKAKIQRIFEALTGEIGQKAQAACKIIRNTKRNAVNFDAISDEIGIEAFDLRYIDRIVYQGKPDFDDGGITVKQFDRNKNRNKRNGRSNRRAKNH